MLTRRALVHLVLAGGALPSAGAAQQATDATVAAKQIKVLSAGSTLYGLRPAAAAFTRASGIAVAVATDHGHNIRKAVLEGAADADIVLVPTEWVSEIIAAGRGDKSSVIEIGAVRIGAAVREGAPRPDIASMAALREALLAADAVLLTLAPTGDHLMKVIERLGLAAEVARKLKRFDTATLLNKHLAETAAAATLGFGPATEILAWRDKGLTYAGAVPDEIQIVLPYQAAMLTRTAVPADARALLAYLASADARRHFQASGVE